MRSSQPTRDDTFASVGVRGRRPRGRRRPGAGNVRSAQPAVEHLLGVRR